MIVFHKLCRTASCTRAHRTESVSVMGHAWLAADSDQRERSFLVHVLSASILVLWTAVPLTQVIIILCCLSQQRGREMDNIIKRTSPQGNSAAETVVTGQHTR